jgi:hypothetical protein
MVHGVWMMLNLTQIGWCHKWMFVTPSIWCYDQPFFRSYDLRPIPSKLVFPIYSTILHTPIPTIFFSSFLTWRFHSHFVEVRYTIGGTHWEEFCLF